MRKKKKNKFNKTQTVTAVKEQKPTVSIAPESFKTENQYTPSWAVPRNNKAIERLAAKIARLKFENNIIQESQIETEIKFLESKELSELKDFLRTLQYSSLADGKSDEVSDNVYDPPVDRFKHSMFWRAPQLISLQEAARIGHKLNTLQEKRLAEIEKEKLKEMEDEQKAQATDKATSRLEELARTGSFKAESDHQWFENSKPVNNDVENLELQVAEKTYFFLKAKRELKSAKRALKSAFKKRFSSKPQIIPEEKKLDFSQLFENRKY